MDNRAIILHCLYENWPDEVSMIGDDLVTRIVDDAFSGNRTEFRAPQGGHNFDLSSDINIIIEASILLVTLADLYVNVKRHRLRRDTPGHIEEDEEDVVKVLTIYLINEKKMKPNKAAKLARMIYRVINDS